MRRMGLILLGTLVAIASDLAGCGGDRAPTGSQTTGNTVNLYMWADEIAPDTLPSFEKLTGIKVNVSYFDSPEMLESHMLTGSSGFAPDSWNIVFDPTPRVRTLRIFPTEPVA